MALVVYEVTCVVDPPLRSDFERYMSSEHIPDVLATRCFDGAAFCRVDGQYRISYAARSRQMVAEYINRHAEALRADFKQKFPVGVEVARTELDIVAAFGPDGRAVVS